jgi:hypothetical protein
MATPLEELYLAWCPFCGYRRLFSSAPMLLVNYGTHLQGHEAALACPWELSREKSSIPEARIAAHAQRIRAAPLN